MLRRRPMSTLFPYTTLFRSVLEALALGAPVVATAIGPHPTWIREGRTGWLVPPRAPAALDRKSTRLNSSHTVISYAVFCLKTKKHRWELMMFVMQDWLYKTD